MEVEPYRDMWVVEFSQSQRAFSVRTLSDAINHNLYLFLRARESDHAIIAAARTRPEADAICACLDDARADRKEPFDSETVGQLHDQLEKLGAFRFFPTAEEAAFLS